MGLISNIQRFSLHDGPGIRTTVFFKGCSVRCAWCHNPETFSMQKQLQYYAARCILCGKCVQLCPNKAHSLEANANGASGKPSHSLDRSRCTGCGVCALECLNNALVISGMEMSVDEVLRQVLDDKPFYDESGGGITLSGGEPVLQGDFCEALLKSSKEQGIHTNIQTAGFYPYEMLERLLPYLDLVMYDIKGISPNIHQNYIKGDISPALDNLRCLDKSGVPIIVRMPCIKGVNDSPSEIEAIAIMLSKLKSLKHFELLPYHGLAKAKYEALGENFVAFEAPDKEHIAMLESLAARYVKVYNTTNME
jgi:pyruvate formate lyase activating enzyme